MIYWFPIKRMFSFCYLSVSREKLIRTFWLQVKIADVSLTFILFTVMFYVYTFSFGRTTIDVAGENERKKEINFINFQLSPWYDA